MGVVRRAAVCEQLGRSKQLCQASHHSSTAIMSDEEFYEDEEVEEEYEEEEEEEEEYEEEVQTNPDERKSVRSAMSEGDGNFLKARQEAKKGELDEQLREYINEWRKQRAKEEEELKRLKEKQAKRKEIRAEQEKKLAQQKKEEEERLRKEEADKKAKEAEEKRKRLEEAEKKRQAMMQAQKEKQQAAGQGAKGPKKTDSGMGNVQDARREMTKTKEQLEEEKKIPCLFALSPWIWTQWMAKCWLARPLNFGTQSYVLRLRNTISRKGKRDRTTISKSSRRDKSNSSDRRP